MAKDWDGMKFPKGGKASMTGAEWLAMSKSKRNKFGAVSTNGFPSKLEAAVWAIHEMRQMAGEIRDLKAHPSVQLTKRVRWKIDASFIVCATGVTHYAEAKGKWTADAGIKLNLWRDGYGPGPLEIWEGDWRAPKHTDTILPDRTSTALNTPESNEPPVGQGTGPSEGPNE